MNDPLHKEEREAAISLVSRIQNNDRLAETEIVQRYNRGLRFLLCRKTRDKQLAEDLLQETWAIALIKLRAGGLTDPGRLAGYLCGIANNLALGDRRRNERQNTSVDSETVGLIADDSASPFTQTSRAEICAHVHDFLEELSQKRDREILQRFYVQELDKQSICQELKIDLTHFNRVLFRARERFKEVVLRADIRSRMKLVR